jgi:hypothetical protein
VIPHYKDLIEAVENTSAMKQFPDILRSVSSTLNRVYQSPVMIASMNLGESHFHIHLYPANMEEIDQWRKYRNVKSGRILSFFGEKESLIDEFEERVWNQSFLKTIHEAANDLSSYRNSNLQTI